MTTATATTSATPLTDEQIERYYREGYALLPQLATPEVVQGVRQAAERFTAEEGGNWTPEIFEHDNPQHEADVHALLTDPQIVGAVTQLFDAEPRVYYGMLAIVPGKGGKGLEWHQDNQYIHLLGRALNMFVAVDDIDPDMAMLWVSPGSHLWGLQPSEEQYGHRKAADPGNGIKLPAMKQGDVCLFDRYTLQRSLTNEQDRPRYAYAAQYMEQHARLAETGKKEANRMLVSELSQTWKKS
jgi:hypothetical protein